MMFLSRAVRAAALVAASLYLAGCPGPSATASLTSFTVTPSAVSLEVGKTQALTVTGTYSDGSTSALTTELTFTSDDASVASVSAAGVVAGIGRGTTNVTVASGSVSSLVAVTVTPSTATKTLSSLALSPSPVSLQVGSTQPLTVTATYSDASTATLSSQLTFTSSSPSVATVTATGLITAVSAGASTVEVTSGGKTAHVTVTVTTSTVPKTLSSLALSPSPVSLQIGSTQLLTVTATYSDASTATLTSQLSFTSSSASVATVSAAGLITAVSVGASTVEVTSGGKTAHVTVTVMAPKTLSSLALSPSPVSLQVGSTQALTVTATYSDASTATLSTQLSFTSSSSSVATVSAAGLITAISAGETTVEVTSGGKTAHVTVTVTAATLNSVTVDPTAADVFVGHTQALKVVGSFSDGTTATITTGVTFASSVEAVASVDSAGLVTGITPGTSTITVTVQGKNATCAVTVRPSPYVFFDDFEGNTSFRGFSGAVNDVARDSTELREGRASLKVVVLAGSSGYAGGAIVSSVMRDLSGFDALTFWVKASKDTPIDVLGTGNNNASGTTGFEEELAATTLTTSWTKVIIPLADPSRRTQVDGLFHFTDGPKDYAVWFSDIQFEKLGAAFLGAPSATINQAKFPPVLGVGGTRTLDTDGFIDFTIANALVHLTRLGWGSFTLTSDAPSVATISPSGVVSGVGVGQATITATLAGGTVSGSFVVSVIPVVAPPSLAPADVISLSTTGYTNHGVDTWKTGWSSATFEDVIIDTHTVKHYSSLDFVGVETTGANLVDASAMTAFHVDVWTSNATAFRVKLVDFGADGAYTGSDNTEAELSFTPSTGGWVAIEIPLADFTAKNVAFQTSHLAQLIFAADPPTTVNLCVDNIYFHR